MHFYFLFFLFGKLVEARPSLSMGGHRIFNIINNNNSNNFIKARRRSFVPNPTISQITPSFAELVITLV